MSYGLDMYFLLSLQHLTSETGALDCIYIASRDQRTVA